MNQPKLAADRFDWDEIKERLARVQRTLEEGDRLTSQQIDAMMKQRAAELAEVPKPTIGSDQLLQVVRFQIGGEEAAIEARWIRSITNLECLTPIPETDSFFLGVTNLRGEIAAVIDLAALLGLAAPKDLTDMAIGDVGTPGETKRPIHVMVLGIERVDCALLVDRFREVTTIDQAEILEPVVSSGILAEVTMGCTRDPVLVLDGRALSECQKLTIDQMER